MGGSAAVGMLIGMVSAKASAVFLGTAGVGEVRLYQGLVGLFLELTGLGVWPSAVRSMSVAEGHGDNEERAALDVAIRRIAWIIGVGGWLLMAALAWPLSVHFYSGAIEPWSVVVLGVTVLLGAVGNGLGAIVLVRREIGLIAKRNLASSAITTGACVACYWLLGRGGVLPALVIGAVVQLITAIVIRRRVMSGIAAPVRPQAWSDTHRIARSLTAGGAGFLASSLLPMVTNSIITAMIIAHLGLESNGLYWAAWSLSGMFSNFVLSAMGADYLPRISAAVHDPALARRLVNEQIEVAVLLGTPGALAMMVLSPIALNVFYSPDFAVAADLVVVFGATMVFQFSSWPVGFLILARARARMTVLFMVATQVLYIAIAWAGMRMFGLVGVAAGLLVHYALLEVLLWAFIHRRLQFRWEQSTFRIMAGSWLLSLLGAASTRLPDQWSGVAGFALIALAGMTTLRGLVSRLGGEHRLVRMASSAPVVRTVVAIAMTRRQ